MDSSSLCRHCELPLDPNHTIGEGFCCHGCETVYSLLQQEGLNRFYDLSAGQKPPVHVAEGTGFEWILDSADNGRLDVSINGIHCTACVWLLEEVFERHKGGQEILINPTLGEVTLRYDSDNFDPVAYFEKMASLGYQVSPRRSQLPRVSQTLLWRVGVSVALSMNVMLMYVSFYMGLDQQDALFVPFWTVSTVLTLLNVVVGGWPFFKTSIQVLRNGILHLDLPIAVGILSSLLSNLVLMYSTNGSAMYLDSLNSFITLMLLGRFFQTRSIENNRQQLQQGEALTDWTVLRMDEDNQGTSASRISVEEVSVDDRLLIPVGSVVPVDSTLLSAHERFSLAWTTGESEPISFNKGDTVPSGAIHLGDASIEVQALNTWDNSELKDLLTIPPSAEHEDVPSWFQPILRWYVPIVLGLSTLGFLWWYSSGLTDALSVMTALLIVTCPCAFGIALPLAKELAVLRLRGQGVFVRTSRFFTRAVDIERVVFDKTGTLTMGKLQASMTQPISSEDTRALYNMVLRSNHPKSQAILALLTAQGSPLVIDSDAVVMEQSGVGLQYGLYNLVKSACGDTVFTHSETVLTAFSFREDVRGDLNAIVQQLADAQISVAILSGDRSEKVHALLKQSGLAVEAHGGLSPQGKADWIVSDRPRQTMMVGDGLNDAKAFDVAGLSVTPANALGGLLSRADVYLTGDNLRSVWLSIHGARYTQFTQQRVFVFALVYNVVVVSMAFLGKMSPLLAAVLMPASSIGLVSYTLWRQRRIVENA